VEGGFAAKNVVAGDPDTAKVIFSAHYDTCAVLPIPNFITPRNMVFYICYQLLFVFIFFAVVFIAELAVFFLTDASVEVGMAVADALCIFMVWWIIDGLANKHTANDNTSGVLTLIETALALPPEQRGRVCFVFFDNEEKGMFGSAAFAKRHKSVKKNTPVLNFDCVGDGDNLLLIPSKYSRWDSALTEALESAFPEEEGTVRRRLLVKGLQYYPSDQRRFKFSVAVCACRYLAGLGYYIPHLRTKKDTVLREKNIACIAQGMARFLPLYLDGGEKS